MSGASGLGRRLLKRHWDKRSILKDSFARSVYAPKGSRGGSVQEALQLICAEILRKDVSLRTELGLVRITEKLEISP